MIFSKSRLIYIIVFLLSILFIFLSFSYTVGGEFIFMSGLFLEDKHIFDISFEISILGTIALVMCAIGLNSSGEVMQATTHNPLASPFSLGLTSSINLIYIINLVYYNRMPIYILGLLAFIFISIFNIFPTYFINKKRNRNNGDNMIFFGIAISSLLNTITLILVHVFSIDAYVYGWITNYIVNVEKNNMITGFFYIFIGFIILIFNMKKLNIYENMNIKSISLGVNINKTILISFLASTFLSIGASVVYAPLMMLGMVIPYITKKFIIKKYSFKQSIILSSLFSVVVLLFSRILLGIIKWNDYNLMLTLILLPLWMVFEMAKIYEKKPFKFLSRKI